MSRPRALAARLAPLLLALGWAGCKPGSLGSASSSGAGATGAAAGSGAGGVKGQGAGGAAAGPGPGGAAAGPGPGGSAGHVASGGASPGTGGGVMGTVTSLPGHQMLGEDTSPKAGPRLIPAEVYLRTYMRLLGVSTLQDAANKAIAVPDPNGNGTFFSTWYDYLGILNLPDPEHDRPRPTQTNTLMLSTLDRLGTALCASAVTSELRGSVPVSQRHVFLFDPPQGTVDLSAFTPGFDKLHRLFLGYPAALAPDGRIAGYFKLYSDVVARHAAPGAPGSNYSPTEAGWALVCYALIRHPEFQLY